MNPLTLILTAAVAGCADRSALLIDPVNLDKLTLREARKLDGLRLYVVFTLDTPPVEYSTETITGPESADPHVERAVHFPTRMAMRLQHRQGERVRVYGTLRVIDHPAMATAGVQLDVWSVIRVEGATLVW